MNEKPFHSKAWLWWTALFILLVGAAFASLIYYTNPGPRIISEDMRRVLMISVVGAGICAISATAHWWMRH